MILLRFWNFEVKIDVFWLKSGEKQEKHGDKKIPFKKGVAWQKWFGGRCGSQASRSRYLQSRFGSLWSKATSHRDSNFMARRGRFPSNPYRGDLLPRAPIFILLYHSSILSPPAPLKHSPDCFLT